MTDVNNLLIAAHHALERLRRCVRMMVNAGLDRNNLADESALMAFCLLGDHEREQLLTELRPYWSGLQGQGLVSGGLDSAPTPELRLMLHARVHTHLLGSISDQLKRAKLAAPTEILRCPNVVRGVWGQYATIHLSMSQDAEYLLIEPDRVFGLQPALLSLESAAAVSGTFRVPIDEGEVTLSLRANGLLYHHRIQVAVEESMNEDRA